MSNANKITAYNRAVLSSLRQDAPDVAERLNAFGGGSLGWWNSIAYWRLTGVDPKDAAGRLVVASASTDPPHRSLSCR